MVPIFFLLQPFTWLCMMTTWMNYQRMKQIRGRTLILQEFLFSWPQKGHLKTFDTGSRWISSFRKVNVSFIVWQVRRCIFLFFGTTPHCAHTPLELEPTDSESTLWKCIMWEIQRDSRSKAYIPLSLTKTDSSLRTRLVGHQLPTMLSEQYYTRLRTRLTDKLHRCWLQ